MIFKFPSLSTSSKALLIVLMQVACHASPTRFCSRCCSVTFGTFRFPSVLVASVCHFECWASCLYLSNSEFQKQGNTLPNRTTMPRLLPKAALYSSIGTALNRTNQKKNRLLVPDCLRFCFFLSLTTNDSADFPIKEALPLRIRKTYLQDMFWNTPSAPLPVAQKQAKIILQS